MSLRDSNHVGIPEETAMVARAAFPRGCLLLGMRDALGPVSGHTRFAHHSPRRVRPAVAPWRLTPVTFPQFAGNLSGRQAADAVRGRLDRADLAGLPFADPGSGSSMPRGPRARLAVGRAGQGLPGAVLAVAVAHKLVRVRVDCAVEAPWQALGAMAVAEPRWLP